MTEYLVIRLDLAPSTTARWIAVDETGALLGPVDHGELEAAVAAVPGRRVIVLVPGTEVLRTRAEVPVKGAGKVLQAVPFALEDQLADDVEALHFAAGPRDSAGSVDVAVVRRNLLDEWQRRLAQAGIEPQQIYAESDAVAHTPNSATLVLQEDTALFRQPDGCLTALEPGEIMAIVDLWAIRQTAADDGAAPHLLVYANATLLDRFAQPFEALRSRLASLELRSLADSALPRLAAQIVTTAGVNLLQGGYARRSSLRVHWPVWRVAAGLLFATLGLSLAVQALEIRSMRREAAALDAQITQAFNYVFPDAGPMADPRAALSEQLRVLGDRNASSSREFLDILTAVAGAFSGIQNTRIEAFSYRSGTLELRVRTSSVEVLDRIQQAVSRGGKLTAQIQSANASGDGVVGRLQVARGGA